MRGLAEFIMRGRWQALAVAILGSVLVLFAWISSAALALVTMARGVGDGAWVALWALLPALLLGWVSGDYGTGLLLLTTFLAAVVLRQTMSLALALVSIVPVSAIGGMALLVFNVEFIEALLALFDDWFDAIEAGNPELAEAGLARPTMVQAAGLMAAGNAMLASLSLLLGRYWQAALYKPGAFGTEFRSLSLPVPWLVIMVALPLAGSMSGGEWATWIATAGMPVTLIGFALLHGVAKQRQWGTGVMVFAYMTWFLVDIAKVLMLLAVVLDAVFDFRKIKARS